ncbi:MAG: hypothetical protein HQ483_00640 [Rhodospirillales bacterium]|nr:hypothetical protein [Rhodospirillales bacterium]
MAMIVSSLAFIVSFAALWMVTSSMKKIDGIVDTIVQQIRSDQRQASDKVNAKIAELTKQNLELTQQLKNLSSEKGKS